MSEDERRAQDRRANTAGGAFLSSGTSPGSGTALAELESAWQRRVRERHIRPDNEIGRVFHGPGEGSFELSRIAIDRFGAHYWITEWEEAGTPSVIPAIERVLKDYFAARSAMSAVLLPRPEKTTASESVVFYGEPPAEKISAQEAGARYWIQLLKARQPGVFLDHYPLRQWLREKMSGLRVLNTFAYTGSLSVASGLGGAASVVTLDLSKPSIRWAEENWKLNELDPEKAKFISGDVFEWLPRLKKSQKEFDCVILDPPSFARGNKISFSTAKDTEKLHALALELVAPGGYLVSSINSAKIPVRKYEADVMAAVQMRGMKMEIVSRIELPDTFPTRAGDPSQRYLKGLILKRR